MSRRGTGGGEKRPPDKLTALDLFSTPKENHALAPNEELKNIRHLFETFLHQDWIIDGETLEEVFSNNHGMGGWWEASGEEPFPH